MKLSKRERIILHICIFAIVLTSLYVFALEPIKMKMKALNEELYGKRMLLEKSRDILSQKDVLESTYAQYENKIKSNDTAQKRLATFAMEIESLAKQSGIQKISGINPLPVRNFDIYNELSVQMSTTCTITSLNMLLYKMYSSDSIYNVEKLRINLEATDTKMLKVQFLISTILIEPEKG